MATVTGLITVNSTEIIEVDAVPSAGGGTAAPIASMAMFDNAGVGQLYLKYGAADTDWSLIDTDAADWSLAGNALTGVEKFGSTNAFEVPFVSNNIEQMRLVGTTLANGALLIGLNASLGGRLQIAQSVAGADLMKEVFGTANQIIHVSRMFRDVTVGAATATFDIAVPAAYNALIETQANAIQTAGSTGAVGDGAAYIRTLQASNPAGTVVINKNQTDYTYEVAGGMNFAPSVSGANVRFTATGVANRDFTWGVRTKLLLVST